MNVSLPQNPILTLGIPIVAAIVSGMLQHAKLPKLWNELIALLFFVGAVMGCYFLGGPLTHNITLDILLYTLGVAVVIETTPISNLRDALVELVPSPLLLLLKTEAEQVVANTPLQGLPQTQHPLAVPVPAATPQAPIQPPVSVPVLPQAWPPPLQGAQTQPNTGGWNTFTAVPVVKK